MKVIYLLYMKHFLKHESIKIFFYTMLIIFETHLPNYQSRINEELRISRNIYLGQIYLLLFKVSYYIQFLIQH